MLRVLIDATSLPAQRGGVGRYVDELVSRLPSLGLDTHVVSQARDVATFAAQVGGDQVHELPRWVSTRATRLGWEQAGLPMLVRRLAPDVVHSPHYTMPILSSVGRLPKTVVTLHDATFFSDPRLHLGLKARFFTGWTTLSAARADALVVPSAATRVEVLRHVRRIKGQVTVIPHGVDHGVFRPAAGHRVAEVRTWLGLRPEDTYVAFLGTLEPRKNVPALVRGFVTACAGRSRPPVLVLAGGKGWDEGVDAAIADVRRDLRVLRAGFVPDRLVPALLSGAEVVAYPALGEGFGLPVLEAMACGAPVLTTRRLALPEVGGEAVAYARTPAADDIATALAALLDDATERERLSQAAIVRAGRFTWETTARQHLAVYTSVMG